MAWLCMKNGLETRHAVGAREVCAVQGKCEGMIERRKLEVTTGACGAHAGEPRMGERELDVTQASA